MSVMSRVEAAFCRSTAWQRLSREAILPRVGAGGDWQGVVLEVGGGSGAMADELLRRWPEVERLVLADPDPAMRAAAEAQLAGHGARASVPAYDGTTLPVEDGSVDTVCSWLMLHHVIGWRALFAEIHRVLRPGGRLVGYDLTRAPLGALLHGLSRSEQRLIAPAELREALAADWDDAAVETRGLAQFMTFRARRPAPARAH